VFKLFTGIIALLVPITRSESEFIRNFRLAQIPGYSYSH
jgi:hypothetical protein